MANAHSAMKLDKTVCEDKKLEKPQYKQSSDELVFTGIVEDCQSISIELL